MSKVIFDTGDDEFDRAAKERVREAKTIPQTLLLDEHLMIWLKKISAEKRTSMSSLANEYIKKGLEHEQNVP